MESLRWSSCIIVKKTQPCWLKLFTCRRVNLSYGSKFNSSKIAGFVRKCQFCSRAMKRWSMAGFYTQSFDGQDIFPTLCLRRILPKLLMKRIYLLCSVVPSSRCTATNVYIIEMTLLQKPLQIEERRKIALNYWNGWKRVYLLLKRYFKTFSCFPPGMCLFVSIYWCSQHRW